MNNARISKADIFALFSFWHTHIVDDRISCSTANMSGYLQPDSPGSASRSKTVVRHKYIARQPSQDYFDDDRQDVHGDFSEFEGNISLHSIPDV